MKQRLIIFGGNGFVGQSIAKAALKSKYEVHCISRSGMPKAKEGWMEQVTWIKADVFKPEQWHDKIQKNDILVDAIGLLFEKKAKGLTYQKFNYEIVPTIIENVLEKIPSSFVFISAAHGLPFFPGYLKWKQQAEEYLAKQSFQTVIIRPSLLYGKGKKYSRLMAEPIVQIRKLRLGRYLFGKIDPRPIDELGELVINKIQKRANEKKK